MVPGEVRVSYFIRGLPAGSKRMFFYFSPLIGGIELIFGIAYVKLSMICMEYVVYVVRTRLDLSCYELLIHW